MKILIEESVLRQALEALIDNARVSFSEEYLPRCPDCDAPSSDIHSPECGIAKAITALRTALERAESVEPVCKWPKGRCGIDELLHDGYPPESVEPVAWMIRTNNKNLHELDPNRECNWLEFDVEQFKHNAARSLDIVDTQPLFARPAVPSDVERDAARYRWFRSKVASHDRRSFHFEGIVRSNADLWRGSVAGHLDSAIDAAMKGGE